MLVACAVGLITYLRIRVAIGQFSLDLDLTDRPFRPLTLTDSLLGSPGSTRPRSRSAQRSHPFGTRSGQRPRSLQKQSPIRIDHPGLHPILSLLVSPPPTPPTDIPGIFLEVIPSTRLVSLPGTAHLADLSYKRGLGRGSEITAGAPDRPVDTPTVLLTVGTACSAWPVTWPPLGERIRITSSTLSSARLAVAQARSSLRGAGAGFSAREETRRPLPSCFPPPGRLGGRYGSQERGCTPRPARTDLQGSASPCAIWRPLWGFPAPALRTIRTAYTADGHRGEQWRCS